MKNFRSYIFLLFSTLLLLSCSTKDDSAVEDIIYNIKEEVAPDKRVAIFDISAEGSGSTIVLTGETDQPEGLSVLEDSLKIRGIDFENEVLVLPDEELGKKTMGVARNSVVNIRSNPRHSAELATQALLGMPLKVLKKEGSWYLIQTPEDYISWIDAGGIQLMTDAELEEWKQTEKIIYLNNFGFSYLDRSTDSQVISDLVMGNVLKMISENGNYYEVEYPDGRNAFVRKNEAMLFNVWKTMTKPTQETLVTTSKQLMGIPYLWGGTSSKGVDCSGFTKTIYLMNGKIIPRDASQQVFAGEFVDDSKDFESLQPGDLIFFGTPATADRSRRVVHVGMWIGNNEFIHSSGRVRISSVDPNAPNFDEFNVNRYLESRRYIEKNEGNVIEVSDMFN